MENVDKPGRSIDCSVLEELKSIVGTNGWSAGEDTVPFCTDWLGDITGKTALVLFPATVDQVSRIVGLCFQHRIGIVPQGGNTSLMGGAVPLDTGDEIVINLSRMNRIRSVDTFNDTIAVEAGCVLASVQEEALKFDRRLALRLDSEGSCQIGGNIATNAGGSNVLRYGSMREQVLGLEVVLPDGRIWNGMRGLRKDNTGYDLKHVFIGSEGTLGIITAEVLKLHPTPTWIETALCAVASASAALELLVACRERMGDALTGFELIPRLGIELVRKHFPRCRCPLGEMGDWQILLECSSGSENDVMREDLEQILAEALEEGTVTDAVLAESDEQRRALWDLRERLAEADTIEGASMHCDISVPISAIPAFLEKSGGELAAECPGCRVMAFGHLGDGNIHYCVIQPSEQSGQEFLPRGAMIVEIVHRAAHEYGGSISAEHGLGRLKHDTILHYLNSTEIDVLRGIKRLLDPCNIMNRGKLVTA